MWKTLIHIESSNTASRTYLVSEAAQCSIIAQNAFVAAARWLFSKSGRSAVSRTGSRMSRSFLSRHQSCSTPSNKSSRTLHPYFTPVAGSFSAKSGRTFAAFLARSRSTLSETGRPGVLRSRCAMSSGVLGCRTDVEVMKRARSWVFVVNYVINKQRKSCIPLVRAPRQDE
jgi:hypothetical protein